MLSPKYSSYIYYAYVGISYRVSESESTWTRLADALALVGVVGGEYLGENMRR